MKPIQEEYYIQYFPILHEPSLVEERMKCLEVVLIAVGHLGSEKQKSQTSRSKLGARTGFEICCHVATYCFVYVSLAAAVIVPQICCSTFFMILIVHQSVHRVQYTFINEHVTGL